MQKNSIIKALIIAAIAGGTLGTATAQVSGYVTDTRGVVVKSGYGLCWRTGYWTPAMATAECDPELVRAPAAAKPVSETISLSSDGLFDFGKSTLKAEGKAKLDDLAAKLKGRSLNSMTINGHTDRIGSDKSNAKLSQSRADAVKSYLAGKGVDGSKITATGKGSSQPKTAAGLCAGKKSAKVIACLAPDRRVDIEATFTK